jgi:hypothetical protein
MFGVMPGAVDDTIESPDYSMLRVSIVDITDDYQDEVMRWSLGDCGDGVYNATTYSFEECDRTAQPPQSPSNVFEYPSTTDWLRKDVWYDLTTREYYTCSDICLKQDVYLCGD